jgi:hypothetical protein
MDGLLRQTLEETALFLMSRGNESRQFDDLRITVLAVQRIYFPRRRYHLVRQATGLSECPGRSSFAQRCGRGVRVLASLSVLLDAARPLDP